MTKKAKRPSAMEEITARQRLIARNALEQEALRVGYATLATEGPEAAVEVLRAYAPAIARLDPQPVAVP